MTPVSVTHATAHTHQTNLDVRVIFVFTAVLILLLEIKYLIYQRKWAITWDVTSKLYTNHQARTDALNVLGRKYNLDKNMVKKKIKSLRSYFAKEHHKASGKKSGSSTEDKYVSPWFAYKPLLFIADTIPPNQARKLGETGVELETFNNTANALAEEVTNHSQTTKDHSFVRRINIKRNVNKMSAYFDTEEEPYKLLKLDGNHLTNTAEVDIFGQLVTAKIKKLNPRNQAVAQNSIINILFGLEMEELNCSPVPQSSMNLSTPSPPTQSSVSSNN